MKQFYGKWKFSKKKNAWVWKWKERKASKKVHIK
jgi:hypothetical protein